LVFSRKASSGFDSDALQIGCYIEEPSQKSFLFIAIRGVSEDSQELCHKLHVAQVRSAPVDFARSEKIYEASHYVQHLGGQVKTGQLGSLQKRPMWLRT
jgi:hypothetical protein